MAAHLHMGTLRVHGWYYDIATGGIQTCDGLPGSTFTPLVSPAGTAGPGDAVTG